MKKTLLSVLVLLFSAGMVFAFDPATVEMPEKGDAKMFENFDRDLKKAEIEAVNNPTKERSINNYLKLVENIDKKMTAAIVKAEKNTRDVCRYDKSLMYLRELDKYNEMIQKINAAYAKVGALVPKTSAPVAPALGITEIATRIQEATRLSLEAHYLAALQIEEKAKKVAEKETAIPHYIRIINLDSSYKDVKARCDAMIKTVMMNTILVIDDQFNTIFNDSEFVNGVTTELKSIAGAYSQYFTQDDLPDFAAAKNLRDYFSVDRMNQFCESKNLGSIGAVVVLMNVKSKLADPKEKVKKLEIARYVLPDGSSFKAAEWEETVEKVRKVVKEVEKAKKKGMSDDEIDIAFQADNPQLYATYKAYAGHLDAAKKEVVAVLEMVTTTRDFVLDVADAYLLTDFTKKKPKLTKFKFDFTADDSVIWYRLAKGTVEDLKTYAPEYAGWYAANKSADKLKTEAEFIRDIKGKAEKEIPELVLKEMKKIKR